MMLPTPISTGKFVKSPSWQQWMQNPEARLQVLGDFTDDDIIAAMIRLPASRRASLSLKEDSTPEAYS
eukprot:10147456-Prorocentrum_lima.AAC.1